MQQMQSSMEMQQMETNLNDLRDILHNLITLSFDQEDHQGGDQNFHNIKNDDENGHIQDTHPGRIITQAFFNIVIHHLSHIVLKHRDGGV